MKHRRSQNVHTKSCLHREPGVTVCTCWLDLEPLVGAALTVMTGENEPCAEYFDIGPFRFECDGHMPGYERRAREYHGGKVTHHATSPQQVGDVDVTFWTVLDD